LVIPTGQIDERGGGGSLMPDGLDQLLTDAELTDLVRFLSELGKPGPFAIGHVPTARRWKYLAAVPDHVTRPDPDLVGQALREDRRLPWATAFSKVAGDLPLAAVRPGSGAAYAVVRCEL